MPPTYTAADRAHADRHLTRTITAFRRDLRTIPPDTAVWAMRTAEAALRLGLESAIDRDEGGDGTSFVGNID